MVGFLVSGLALLAVAREMRPLALLSRLVTSFGRDGPPQRLPERGAREVRVLIGAIIPLQVPIADRTSVVSGQRLSVPVDIGARSILKNKNTITVIARRRMNIVTKDA